MRGNDQGENAQNARGLYDNIPYSLRQITTEHDPGGSSGHDQGRSRTPDRKGIITIWRLKIGTGLLMRRDKEKRRGNKQAKRKTERTTAAGADHDRRPERQAKRASRNVTPSSIRTGSKRIPLDFLIHCRNGKLIKRQPGRISRVFIIFLATFRDAHRDIINGIFLIFGDSPTACVRAALVSAFLFVHVRPLMYLYRNIATARDRREKAAFSTLHNQYSTIQYKYTYTLYMILVYSYLYIMPIDTSILIPYNKSIRKERNG